MQALELKKKVFSGENPLDKKVHQDSQPWVNGGVFAVPGAETVEADFRGVASIMCEEPHFGTISKGCSPEGTPVSP